MTWPVYVGHGSRVRRAGLRAVIEGKRCQAWMRTVPTLRTVRSFINNLSTGWRRAMAERPHRWHLEPKRARFAGTRPTRQRGAHEKFRFAPI